MQYLSAFLFFAMAILVSVLVAGVQKAKRNGTYLQPDVPSEYGAELDETTFPEEDEFDGVKVTKYIYGNEDENYDEQGDYVSF